MMEREEVMPSRADEFVLLSRCTEVALAGKPLQALDEMEANVFRVAGMVLKSSNAEAAQRLLKASSWYFDQHPEDRMPASQVVQLGWITSLPRLHDMLCASIQHQSRQGKQDDPSH
jgi:hypothetical protein